MFYQIYVLSRTTAELLPLLKKLGDSPLSSMYSPSSRFEEIFLNRTAFDLRVQTANKEKPAENKTALEIFLPIGCFDEFEACKCHVSVHHFNQNAIVVALLLRQCDLVCAEGCGFADTLEITGSNCKQVQGS